MDLNQILVDNYELAPITSLQPTEHGSGGKTFFVATSQGKYVAKLSNRMDFIQIYDRVQRELNQQNFLQSKIIRTKVDQLMTPEGVVLYQHLNGESHKILSPTRLENAIKYMKKYHQALQSVPFQEGDLAIQNHWDLASSLEFMTEELPTYLAKIVLPVSMKKPLTDALASLTQHRQRISQQPRQLIHADLGGDNFLFAGDEVVAIIDFTPQYSQELAALSQFIYWNYLWRQQGLVEREKIDQFLNIYDVRETERELFDLFLLRAAVYRIVGPLLEKVKVGEDNFESLERRFEILRDLVKYGAGFERE